MSQSKKTFAILIATKNRIADLKITLAKIGYLLSATDLECVIFDDGCTDGTADFISENYPEIQLLRNEVSKGYLFCRNKMLNETQADFAISLDDDAHFVTDYPLEKIAAHFQENQSCGLIAMRIFWGLTEPKITFSAALPQRVQGFVGCAHVWRMKAWREIPSYPEWFIFYGEEDFAAYQLYKKDWQVQYLPSILVNHRVDLKLRKQTSEYTTRLRRSLFSGWCLFLLFRPVRTIPRIMLYSIAIQFKNKVFKGDFKALKAICLALFDLFFAIPKIIRNANRLSMTDFIGFNKLATTKIYWRPSES